MMTKDYVPEKFRDCPQLFYDVLIRGEQKTRTKDVIDPSNDRLREAATVTYQSTLSAVDISAQLIRSQCVRHRAAPPSRSHSLVYYLLYYRHFSLDLVVLLYVLCFYRQNEYK